MDSASAVQPLDTPGACALCHRILPLEYDVIGLESISICGDCKFLFLEDSDTPSHHIHRRTPRPRRTTTRYNNTNTSESIENIFSHHFSTMINNQSSRHHNNPPPPPPHVPLPLPDLDNHSIDTSSRGSRRWRRVFSDTESDGFDSVYGESDAISYGVYGGDDDDSDASIDVHSFLGDSDTDIDPMHAGFHQWTSDDEDINNNNNNNNTLGSLIARVHLQRTLASENDNSVHVRISERRQRERERERERRADEIEGHSGDYLDARSFEELVERLAEADNSRRGAPPASVTFVENLEKVVVVEKGEYDGVVCAICKESFCVGGVVNRLPCFHVYHGGCIKPWLSSRNSCPLCRFELPTDDMEYENRKEIGGYGLRVEEEIQPEEEGAFTSFHNVANDESGSGRGRWLFVVSMVGIGLALWLGGNPGAIRGSGQRGNRSRRWWSLF